MVSVLHRKLVRELFQMRAQAVSIALLVATGVAVFVCLYGSMRSLEDARAAHYEAQRFAQVFASVVRAPRAIEARIRAIAGVGEVEARLVTDVRLIGLGPGVPAVGRLVSLPRSGVPRLNDLLIRRGRAVNPLRPEECVVSEAFADARHLGPGDSVAAIVNGHRFPLEIVGVALSPEYVFALRPGELAPDERRFGVFWTAEERLAQALDMVGAFNDVSLSLAPGASERSVIAGLDALLSPYGSGGARPRSEQLSHLSLTNKLAQISTQARAMPVIFLAVAAFLINVVLARIVSSQRPILATLKAFGYSHGAIAVAQGAPLAHIAPADPPQLDARSRMEAKARRSAAEAARRRATVTVNDARAEHGYASQELERTRRLVASGGLPTHDLEAAEQQERSRRQALEAAELGAQVAAYELALAEAPLAHGDQATPGSQEPLALPSPIRGQVLRVLQRDGMVVTGTPLLEVGDVSELEVVADVLTTSAAQIPSGGRVTLGRWGGESTLAGHVRRVEPSAFTKMSALGVEEQRVPVIIELDERAPGLGDGYRVEVQITLWEQSPVLKVPLGALFRDGERWAVMVMSAGRAHRHAIELGHTAATEAEVLGGVAAGDHVILYPGDEVTEGTRVVPR